MNQSAASPPPRTPESDFADSNAAPAPVKPSAAATTDIGCLRKAHTTWATEVAEDMRRGKRLNQRLAAARLSVAIAGVVTLIAAFSEPSWGFAAAGLILVFASLVALHSFALKRQNQRERWSLYLMHRKAQAELEWEGMPEYSELALAAGAEVASDLDITGEHSLLRRLNACISVDGEQRLAEWLLTKGIDAEVVRRRRSLLQTWLAHPETLRQWSELYQPERRPSPAALAAWAKRPEAATASFVEKVGALAPFILPLIWIAVWWAGPKVSWGATLTVAAFAFASGLVTASRSRVSAILSDADLAARDIRTLRNALAVIQTLQATANAKGNAQLDNSAPSAGQLAKQLASLETWLSFAELRSQPLVHLPLVLLTAYDTLLARRVRAQRRHLATSLEPNLETLAELDAASALAWYTGMERAAVWPTISAAPCLSAAGLAHPLLPAATRIANDVPHLVPGSVLWITGSNMAGKSTLLRAVGLNWSLALAGAPVCATQFEVGPSQVRTSMRVEDSLARGESHFAAELRRVAWLTDDLSALPPVLFEIDELFRGTNAQARHSACAAVLAHLLRAGAFGLFATHDTSIAQHPSMQGFNLIAVHFTDILEDGAMHFDYRLRNGVVTSSNALALVASLGIPIPELQAPSSQT